MSTFSPVTVAKLAAKRQATSDVTRSSLLEDISIRSIRCTLATMVFATNLCPCLRASCRGRSSGRPFKSPTTCVYRGPECIPTPQQPLPLLHPLALRFACFAFLILFFSCPTRSLCGVYSAACPLQPTISNIDPSGRRGVRRRMGPSTPWSLSDRSDRPVRNVSPPIALPSSISSISRLIITSAPTHFSSPINTPPTTSHATKTCAPLISRNPHGPPPVSHGLSQFSAR